jgi:hypothetical protein
MFVALFWGSNLVITFTSKKHPFARCQDFNAQSQTELEQVFGAVQGRQINKKSFEVGRFSSFSDGPANCFRNRSRRVQKEHNKDDAQPKIDKERHHFQRISPSGRCRSCWRQVGKF